MPNLKYDLGLELQSSPLSEAWLELRWQLDEDENNPELKHDPMFNFALGAFYAAVKDRFGFKVDLPISRIPADMAPHAVRHQFRPSEEETPLLQLGPGVASVNLVPDAGGIYTWKSFLPEAHYLRKNLVSAYGDDNLLRPTGIFLRYRNAVIFDYSSGNLLDFLADKLNTSITLSDNIPGELGTENPQMFDCTIGFNLTYPKGRGLLRIVTANKKIDSELEAKNTEAIVFDLVVSSEAENAPSFYDEDEFSEWLELAHAVAHEWFFSLIEGPLREKYEIGE